MSLLAKLAALLPGAAPKPRADRDHGLPLGVRPPADLLRARANAHDHDASRNEAYAEEHRQAALKHDADAVDLRAAAARLRAAADALDAAKEAA